MSRRTGNNYSGPRWAHSRRPRRQSDRAGIPGPWPAALPEPGLLPGDCSCCAGCEDAHNAKPCIICGHYTAEPDDITCSEQDLT